MDFPRIEFSGTVPKFRGGKRNFTIFLERIIIDALEDHQGTVRTWGRTIKNLCFADDIDGLSGKEEEPAFLVDRLDKTSTAFGLEISAQKTTLMINNTK